MLVALGRILQGSPIPIIGGLTLLQLLAMHVPLLLFGTLFAGIVAAFLMLVRPPREAALILILSGIACAAISYLIAAHAMAFLSPLIFLGTPALLATILRLSDSLSLAILCGFVGAWIGAQLLGLLSLDLDAAWIAALETFRQAALEAERAEPFGGVSSEWLSQIGAEVVMASLALLSTLLLLLARKWQSTLAETPFFGLEFRATRYGRVADIIFLVTVITAWWIPSPFMLGLSLTLITAFLFPGIATMHRLSGRIRYPLAVLIPFYLLLLSLPEVLLVTATLGAAEDLLGWGRRSAGTNDIS
ncbi:MAG: hypothetical protein OXJ38_00115 [Gammaproteobacteria bacterium]|nr:hypothetical protein [Gammaproteobacteria bacterium]MDE0612756.1 hypothetical protein [Gammaproteobacteria bacterium]